ncbi:hypothetical protein FACS1894214_4200 [Planctomycetales bacterium]|nr:hypothetical protein FACS1894214_4200 [Planctomycetales bacterium]
MDIENYNGASVIWVFCGNGRITSFPSACFTSKKNALAWANNNKVSGCLTAYPLDISVYDWATSNAFFIPKFPSQKKPEFIQTFSSAYLEHYHIENGVCEEYNEE